MNNPFEQHIKQSLENYEAPYNPADWADLQNRLSKAKAGKSNISKGLMIAASVAAVAGAIYYFSATHSENNKQENAVVTSQNIVQNEVKEIPVQKTEVKDQQPISGKQSAVSGENSSKEKVVAANNPAKEKAAVPEKIETQKANTVTENKPNIQNQPLNINPQPLAIPVLKASFHSDLNKVCEGAPVQFTADNSDGSFTYKWSFGDGETSAEQNPKHSYSEAGMYIVKLRVISVKDNKSDEQNNRITVLAAPSLKMNYSASNNDDLLINFDANADKVTEWKWDFGDRQNSAEQYPAHTYRKKGDYTVSVTAKNSFGCAAIVKQTVNVENKLYAPSAFSPNGDGHNDTWIPAVGDKIFTVTIYDKSGNPVFTITDKDHPWEGQNTKVGETFMWKAVVKEKNGEESNYKGFITISE